MLKAEIAASGVHEYPATRSFIFFLTSCLKMAPRSPLKVGLTVSPRHCSVFFLAIGIERRPPFTSTLVTFPIAVRAEQSLRPERFVIRTNLPFFVYVGTAGSVCCPITDAVSASKIKQMGNFIYRFILAYFPGGS
jgi:hypothetical protein